MKFIVRVGFVVHDRKVVEVANQLQVREASYFEGDEVDFDADTADQHLHKLEPKDKEAKAYVEAKFPVVVAPVAVGIDYTALASAMVAAMGAAMDARSSAPKSANPPAAT